MPARAPLPPFDTAALERAALRYVERYATTAARLRRFLQRKLRERGWAGDDAPPVDPLIERLVTAGYIDDAAFAAARGRAADTRGIGATRLRATLTRDGIAADLTDAEVAHRDPLAAAVTFARRKRLGPFGPPALTPRDRQRQLAAMARGGHPLGVARRVLATRDPAELDETE